MWRFRIPGSGSLDWKAFFTVLMEAGYQGAMNIEHEDSLYGTPYSGRTSHRTSRTASLSPKNSYASWYPTRNCFQHRRNRDHQSAERNDKDEEQRNQDHGAPEIALNGRKGEQGTNAPHREQDAAEEDPRQSPERGHDGFPHAQVRSERVRDAKTVGNGAVLQSSSSYRLFVRIAQKLYFNPNCSCRESTAVELITP
jgi:hypothetical protein